MIRRRTLLQAALAGPTLAAATVPSAGERRFVFVILRGGLDGLHAVPALGDPAFAAARGPLAQFGRPALPLQGLFALHPELTAMHAMFQAGDLAVVHATGLPYQQRSHFDAQQVLESGGLRPHELGTGWLGRALAAGGGRAVALETAVPLVLRGADRVDTWAPSSLPGPSADLVARLVRLYAADAPLAHALQRASGLHADAASVDGNAPRGRGAAVALAQKAAEFLQRGLQVAVLDLSGWDSHANQAAPQGALTANLRQLDAALGALRDGLTEGGTWNRTAVLVATEFGREVGANGTLGTDHGSGGAAFVLGGAVRGGRVLADWPGLAPKDRFEGRDLRITTDLRAVQRALLGPQLGLAKAALDTALPGSSGLPAPDLLKS